MPLQFVFPIMSSLLLLPPFLVLTAVLRMQKRRGWKRMTRGFVYGLLASFSATVANYLILLNQWPLFSNGQVEFNVLVFLGLLISWCSIWARLLLRPLRKKRRRRAH